MNYRALIIAVSGVIVLLLLATGFVAVNQLQVTQDQDAARTSRDLSLSIADELRQSSDDLTTSARSFVATGDVEFERDYFKILDIRSGAAPRPEDYTNIYWDYVFATGQKPRDDSDVSISIEDLAREAEFTDEEMKFIEQSNDESSLLAAFETEAFNAAKGRFKDKNGNFARIGLADTDLATKILFSKEYFLEKQKFMEPILQLRRKLENRTAATLNALEDRRSMLGNFFVGLVVLIFTSLGILAFLIWKQSQAELEKRQKAQQKAEDENEQLNDSVINILQAVSSLSARDLTARAPVTEDVIGTVSDSINLLADETATVLKGVTGIAGQVSSVSETVSMQAAQVSQTAEEERKSVQQMIETLFDATQTMNQVAALADQSNESAAQATEITESALETVTQTVGGMESIRETISETEKRIKRLGERSQEISGIVNLINTISERTHVLALNASMQAAVAGEAGRGFAVVAEEVQQLAESSRNATEQIATLVNNIQIETNETINTVNRTIGQVVEGSEQAQQAGEQMRRTQQITAELVARVQNIAQASQKQKNMSAQLLEAVQAIGDSTEKTATQIDAQNAGTEELRKAAKQLVDSVNVFKLPA